MITDIVVYTNIISHILLTTCWCSLFTKKNEAGEGKKFNKL